MTINEWDIQQNPRSPVLLEVHESILAPVDLWIKIFFLKNGPISLEEGSVSVQSPCPTRIEWVSLPFSKLSWVCRGGLSPVLPSHCLSPGLIPSPFGGPFPQGLEFPAPSFHLLGHSQAQGPVSLQYVHWSFSKDFLSLFG